MKKMQQGFTLIELMIVVAIIGILAAIAIPQYQDYVTRSKWQHEITSLESVKTLMAECAQNNNGDFTNCVSATQLGLTAFPTLDYGMTFPTFTAAGTAPSFTVSGTLDGSALSELGKCTVTVTGSQNNSQITWSYVNGGGCTKRKTGVGS